MALRLLLNRLGALDAALVDCYVDSRDVRHLDLNDRRILPAAGLPLRLARAEAETLRLELTRLQRPIGRRPGARGPGNRTRRMRMVTDIRADTADLDEIRACLANGLPSRVDADEAGIAVLVRGRAGQGFANDVAVRRVIERHAVDSACRRLRTEGWTVDDVGDTESFDLRCTREGEELHVEVKGTTSAGASVMVTSNEVRHARIFPRVALFVVSAIRLLRDADGRPRAEGGDELLINPWVPADDDLEPLAFRCKLR